MANQTPSTQEGPAFGPSRVAELKDAVARIVDREPVTDIHTHLYAPPFGELLLWGVDELLTYHYLIAEAVRASGIAPGAFYDMDKRGQADFVWRTLFLERSPISEACRGVLTVLERLGLDVASRDLDAYRAHFAAQDIEAHIDRVFETARLESVVMTNDPFDETERPVWIEGFRGDRRFHASLRIDPLLNDWEKAQARLAGWGYAVAADFGGKTVAEVRRFLEEWVDRTRALYMAVSLPPDFAFPEDSPRGRVIAECILPLARDRGIPFAMMIGVKRGINPALRLAGDGLAKADLGSLQHLCAENPDCKFMTTLLSRENQHEVAIMARKLPNLFLFGCWWFLNVPALVREITEMRLQLLGLSVTPQHSDARVLEQVVYKWEHSRLVIGQVLQEEYARLVGTGWTVTEEEIRRDVGLLFGRGFWEFIGREAQS